MKKLLLPGIALLLAWQGGTESLRADNSIESLLSSYRKASDLSRKTKDENAGFVVVYTRDDLERMQVYRLSDLIKTMRLIRYDINSFGLTDPLENNPIFYSSDQIKVYVNEHEITSGISGSGLLFYGNIDMGMFDHVEIYYGAPILDISTEPASAVIKLYTKNPERELGGNLQARIGARKTQELSLSHAMVFDQWSYFAYAEEAENNFRHTEHLGSSVSRDYSQQHLYFDLHRQNHRVELEYLGQKHDPFTAQSMEITPQKGSFTMPTYRLSYSGDWLGKEMHLDLSYVHSKIDMDMSSFSPFWGELLAPFVCDPSAHASPSDFSLNADSDLFTAKGYYRHRWDAHLFKVGLVYRYKHGKIGEYRFNDSEAPDSKASFNIYSIYLQDQISLEESAMLSVSLKFNWYDYSRHDEATAEDYRKCPTMKNGDVDDSLKTWQGRVGYNKIFDNHWYFKTFLTHTEYPTQLYELTMHNAQFDSTKNDSLAAEIKFSHNGDTARVTGRYTYARDAMIVMNLEDLLKSNRIEKMDFPLLTASIDYSHRFDENNRIDFNGWYTFVNKEMGTRRKEDYGGFLRLLDTVERFDLFNEFVYRRGRDNLPGGWDYNAGIRYHVNGDLTISLKGVNILNDARETSYHTLKIPANRSLPYDTGTLALPVVERQVYLSLEWFF
ncbi:TonB-dependent receptor [Hydrogenimonas sp. SS33]|uniref:TonB-dependent receptor plug domain-containing protein n=1 Tax=Hydrogenimonas leucolamina TaxID=2954236 RepID=UPI00336BF27E